MTPGDPGDLDVRKKEQTLQQVLWKAYSLMHTITHNHIAAGIPAPALSKLYSNPNPNTNPMPPNPNPNPNLNPNPNPNPKP